MEKQSPIRQVETNVLDRKHLSNRIFKLSHENAVRRLLKTFGDATRDMARYWDSREYTWWVKSLNHCLRWAYEECPTEGFSEDPDWRTQDKSALDLLLWGVTYARLFNDHVAWSRGLIQASIDRPNKTITFDNRGLPHSFVLDQQEKDSTDLIRDASAGGQLIQAIYRRWRPQVRWNTIEGLVYPQT